MRLLCVLLLLHMFCLVLGDTSSPGHSSLQMHRVPRGSRHEAQKKRDQQPREPDTYFTTPRSLQSLNSTATSEHEAEMPTQPRGSPGLYNPLYPLSHASYSAYSITLLALMVFSVGVVGNLAVMCIVWHNQYMTNAWNCVLASVAFWDFLVLFFCLPVVVFHELTQRRVLGDFSCRLVPYMEVTSLGVATFSLCALSIDRFHAATSTQPKVPRVERCHSILAKLAVVWLGSMLLAVPELLLWQLSGEAAADGLRDSCSMNPSRGLPESLYSLVLTYHDARTWWYFGCYFCLPVLFTILCQLATWRVGGASETECSSSSSVRQEQQERRLSHTVLALAVAYGICTLPENVCNMVQAYAPQPPSDSTLALLLLVNQFFLFLRCAATPVLLLCLCRSLGQAFLDCCCCCCEACVQDVSSTPAGSASASPTCQTKQKSASDLPSSIFFDKAKESSCILTLGASC